MEKNHDASTTSLRLFLATIGALILGMIVMTVLSTLLMTTGVFSLAELAETTSSVGGRQGLRIYVMLGNLVPFTGSALLALWFVYRARWQDAAGLRNVVPPAGSVAYGTLFFVVGLPLVGWLAYWNLQLPLPDWMEQSERNTDLLLEGILRMETVPEFLLAFLTVAVTPAIGEELLLRGVLQRRIFRVWFGNAHAGIWAAAVLFSAMHFEFAGFAPRLLLGALLGYAYYWSRSLWVPVGLHLLFNGLQVVIAYVTGAFNPGEEMTDVPPWWLGIISLGTLLYVGYLAEQRFGEQTTSKNRVEEERLGGGNAGAK